MKKLSQFVGLVLVIGCGSDSTQPTIPDETPEITTVRLHAAWAAVPYNADLETLTGDPSDTWTILSGNLPVGLALDASGRLSGQTSAKGAFPFSVRVERGRNGRAAQHEFTLTACGSPPVLEPGGSLLVEFPDACGTMLADEVGALYRVGLLPRDPQSDQLSGDCGENCVVVPPVMGGLRLVTRRSALGAAPTVAVGPEASSAWANPRGASDLRQRDHELLQAALFSGLQRFRQSWDPQLDPSGVPAGSSARVNQTAPAQRTFLYRSPVSAGQTEVAAATLRGETEHVIYYQESTIDGTSHESSDQRIQEVLEYYELYGHDVIQNAFGGFGPVGSTLAFSDGPRDPADLDGNGKFIVLEIDTPLRQIGAGYVDWCDKLPRPENATVAGNSCSGSNEAEITYIPEPRGAYWKSAVVHEAKHISSVGWQLYQPQSFAASESWIEEGTAHIAWERSARAALGIEVGARASLEQLLPGGDSPLSEDQDYMRRVLEDVEYFVGAAPRNGIVGNPQNNTGGSRYYGSGWLFHRYLADQLNDGDEDALFRALNEVGPSIAGLQVVTGQSFSDLLAGFAEAVAHGGDQTATPPEHAFLTYDFVDVYGRGVWPWAAAHSTFQDRVIEFDPIYYTSLTYVDLRGTGPGWLHLDVETVSGLAPPSALDLALSVVRIR